MQIEGPTPSLGAMPNQLAAMGFSCCAQLTTGANGGRSSEAEPQPVKLLARWQNPAFTPYELNSSILLEVFT